MREFCSILVTLLAHAICVTYCKSSPVRDDCTDPLCKPIYGPVCGTDAKTYNNTCDLEVAACLSKGTIQLADKGKCTVPEWFSLYTRFCYQWHPDGDAGQCGGGAARKLCTTGVNTYTGYYRDDTDNRGGGCQMSWGIEAPKAPWWFQYTQLCYRWYADGDAGQCGGGASRLLCASIGKYTNYYRDDTDNRGGGCQMSWRIRVPWFSPTWMRAIRLCYNWYPDGDGGQCGGGAQRLLCARADQWTSYYRDDTDNRGGGCQMRWGLFYP